ncbi:hypothetical protein [Paenibacillus wynnii]|uniref:hypothetical protein n=1 Tax=Paenibacillus wynnii TaxID=268407 RepID=UPI0040397CBD
MEAYSIRYDYLQLADSAHHLQGETPYGCFGLEIFGEGAEGDVIFVEQIHDLKQVDTFSGHSVDLPEMGHKHRAKTGSHNGKVPLGYRVVKGSTEGRGKNTEVVVVEEEACSIRDLLDNPILSKEADLFNVLFASILPNCNSSRTISNSLMPVVTWLS